MDEKIITIFGTGRALPGDAVYELAEKLAGLLAKAGFTIANGGYGGTMTAAAKGSAEAGGEIIGVTCSAFKGKTNKYISREITTKSLDERLETLIELGQAYVVLPGGTGTLLELAKVWELKNKGFLEPEKPIILTGEFWKPLVELLKIDDPDSGKFVIRIDKPEQIVQFLSDNLQAGIEIT